MKKLKLYIAVPALLWFSWKAGWNADLHSESGMQFWWIMMCIGSGFGGVMCLLTLAFEEELG